MAAIKPIVNFDQALAYDPQKPETRTASRIVNAVIEAIPEFRPVNQKTMAHYLGISERALSGAIELDLGLPFIDFLERWRLLKLQQIKAEQPELKGDELAHRLGFYDRAPLWLFMRRNHLKTGRPPRKYDFNHHIIDYSKLQEYN